MRNCEFHRKIPAKWNCSSCNVGFCHKCVSAGKDTGKVYCPVCMNTLEIVLQPSNRPIWEQLGEHIPLPISRRSSDITPLPYVLYKAQILRKDGKNREAIEYLQWHLSQKLSIDDTHIRTRHLFHELLQQEKQSEEMLQHGKKYISILITHGIPKKAFPIYRDCIKTDRSFRLEHAEHTFKLCKAAYNAMDYRLLLAASDGFVNHHSDYHGIVELYLMVAKTLSNEYRRDKHAVGLLRFLLKRYPDHELVPEVEKQLKLADRLEGSSPH